MSSPVAAHTVDSPAKVAAAPESKAKKPRPSQAKKEKTEKAEKPEKKKAEPKEKKETKAKETSKEEDKEEKDKAGVAAGAAGAGKRKTPGEKHPPFEEIIRECIAEATGDVRDGVSRPAIKSTSLYALLVSHCCRSATPLAYISFCF